MTTIYPILLMTDSTRKGLTQFWKLFSTISCVPKDFKCLLHRYVKVFVSRIKYNDSFFLGGGGGGKVRLRLS